MGKVEAIVVCSIVFIVAGFLAYIVESIWFRHVGRIGSYESLWEYFRKIDQKNGNFTAIVWAVLWILLMILGCLGVYALS